MEEKIKSAAYLGHRAFTLGMCSIPMRDKSFTDILFDESNPPGSVLKLLTAWTDAWHTANAANAESVFLNGEQIGGKRVTSIAA